MAIYKFDNKIPEIGENSFISETAIVVGDVKIGNNCYIGHNAIIRGDYGKIVIEDGTAIEEGANLHIRPDGLLKIEKMVTVGHGAILHCNRVKSFAVIGIGAVVSFDVVVGKWSIIAEGSTISKGIKIDDNKIVTGLPFKIIGNVEEKHKKFWLYVKKLYSNLAKKYNEPDIFERVD